MSPSSIHHMKDHHCRVNLLHRPISNPCEENPLLDSVPSACPRCGGIWNFWVVVTKKSAFRLVVPAISLGLSAGLSIKNRSRNFFYSVLICRLEGVRWKPHHSMVIAFFSLTSALSPIFLQFFLSLHGLKDSPARKSCQCQNPLLAGHPPTPVQTRNESIAFGVETASPVFF